MDITVERTEHGYLGVANGGGDLTYRSVPHADTQSATRDAEAWSKWFRALSKGRADSIYYILAVPDVWPGPPPDMHPYTGLRVKIGRAKDVVKAQESSDRDSERLIIHALEPGHAARERELHEQFASDVVKASGLRVPRSSPTTCSEPGCAIAPCRSSTNTKCFSSCNASRS